MEGNFDTFFGVFFLNVEYSYGTTKNKTHSQNLTTLFRYPTKNAHYLPSHLKKTTRGGTQKPWVFFFFNFSLVSFYAPRTSKREGGGG